MKAIRLRARGGPESLAFEDAPTPCPWPGEVLVRGAFTSRPGTRFVLFINSSILQQEGHR